MDIACIGIDGRDECDCDEVNLIQLSPINFNLIKNV